MYQTPNSSTSYAFPRGSVGTRKKHPHPSLLPKGEGTLSGNNPLHPVELPLNKNTKK
jgi:hypothetical protein